MESREFQFKNFKPEPSLEKHVQRVMERIAELAPYDSSAVGLLEKLENGYWGSLDIYSRGGPFIARSFAGDPREVLDGLALKMEVKLSQWRRQRFREKPARSDQDLQS